MALVLTVNVGGTPDVDERKTMESHIDMENEWRVIENTRLASLDPPGKVWDVLPKSTGPERKAGYEAYLNRINNGLHVEYVKVTAEKEAEKVENKEAIHTLRAAYLAADNTKKAAMLAEAAKV